MKNPKTSYHSINIIERKFLHKHNNMVRRIRDIKGTPFSVVSISDPIEQQIRQIRDSIPKDQFIKEIGMYDGRPYVDICVGVRHIAIPERT